MAKQQPSEEKRRYYIHGDFVDGEMDKYYCAACDWFVERAHFYSGECRCGNDYERFLRSKKVFNSIKKKGSNFQRPSNAKNLFE
jgi:hypothetical protein